MEGYPANSRHSSGRRFSPSERRERSDDRKVEGGPNRCQQRRRVDAANECMMLPLEEFGHLPSQEVQEHCLQFQSLTDLLQ